MLLLLKLLSLKLCISDTDLKRRGRVYRLMNVMLDSCLTWSHLTTNLNFCRTGYLHKDSKSLIPYPHLYPIPSSSQDMSYLSFYKSPPLSSWVIQNLTECRAQAACPPNSSYWPYSPMLRPSSKWLLHS